MCEQPLADHGQDIKACLSGLDLFEAELESDLMHTRNRLSRMQVTNSLSLSVGHQVRLCKTKGAVFPVLLSALFENRFPFC